MSRTMFRRVARLLMSLVATAVVLQPSPGAVQARGSATAAAAPTAQQADITAITNTAEAYVAAARAGDGDKAATFVDAKTLKWYGDAAKLSVTANAKQLARVKLAHQLTILRLRHELPKVALKTLTGKQAMSLGVEKGWVDKANLDNFTIAKVKVTGKTARASLKVAPTQFILPFVKEGKTWKLAFVEILELTNGVFEKAQKDSGMARESFFTFLIESTSTRKVNPAIFEGPLESIDDAAPPGVNEARTLQSKDGAVQVMAPAGWIDVNDLNGDAIIQIGNGVKDVYAIVISDDKGTFEDFDAFDEVAVTATRTNLNDTSKIKPKELTINGLAARQYELTGTVNGLSISYLYTTINGTRGYYQIMLWTLKDRYAANKPDFLSITESFEELAN